MGKEKLDYEIRTEGFEKILLAFQHITQRIKKGEKCVATIQYDPDALFTKITTVTERHDSGRKHDFYYEPSIKISKDLSINQLIEEFSKTFFENFLKEKDSRKKCQTEKQMPAYTTIQRTCEGKITMDTLNLSQQEFEKFMAEYASKNHRVSFGLTDESESHGVCPKPSEKVDKKDEEMEREMDEMNAFIEKNEIDEIKQTLAKWAKDFPNTYNPDKRNPVSFTEKEFYTLAKRVKNLEIQNIENANLKLSDFLIGDIIRYLMENEEVKAYAYVEKNHEYDIRTNFAHIHGSGEDRIIVVL